MGSSGACLCQDLTGYLKVAAAGTAHVFSRVYPLVVYHLGWESIHCPAVRGVPWNPALSCLDPARVAPNQPQTQHVQQLMSHNSPSGARPSCVPLSDSTGRPLAVSSLTRSGPTLRALPSGPSSRRPSGPRAASATAPREGLQAATATNHSTAQHSQKSPAGRRIKTETVQESNKTPAAVRP